MLTRTRETDVPRVVEVGSPMHFDELSMRQRLTLADGARAPELLVDRRVVDVQALQDAGCLPECIVQAGVTISMLQAAGEVKLDTLLKLGFDSSHLATEPLLTDQLIRAFGAPKVREAFLRTQSDAIVLAGKVASLLDLRTGDLLRLCVASPDAAMAVLSIQGLDSSVSYDILHATHIKEPILRSAGVTALDLMRHCHLTAPQLHAMGYTMRL